MKLIYDVAHYELLGCDIERVKWLHKWLHKADALELSSVEMAFLKSCIIIPCDHEEEGDDKE